MDSFFQRLNKAMNPTKTESERRRAFREQMKKNTDNQRNAPISAPNSLL